MAIALSPRLWSVTPEEHPPSGHHGGVFVQIASGAFGDGSHPTTRLCAGAVDLLCRQRRPQAVLDVGTGTGILARIARAQGAERVVGTDLDPEALEVARANAAYDKDKRPIEWSTAAPDAWGAVFDLVVANVLEQPLLDLAPAIVRALGPEGAALLSGFTPLQVPALDVRYRALGLHQKSVATLDGWAIVQLQWPR